MSARENLFEAIVTATTRGQCDEANMIRLVEAYRVEVLISAGVEYEDCPVCGAARGVGNPCNTCAFKALIASKVGKREEATAAAATATPGPTGRTGQLLDSIRTVRGEWTTHSVVGFYRVAVPSLAELPAGRLKNIARGDLRDLAAWGHLVQREGKGRRFYTLKTRKDGRS